MALQESGGARKRKSSKNKSNSSDKENDVLPKKVKDALSSPSEASNRKRGSQAQTVPCETISLISSDEDDETTQKSTRSEKLSETERLTAKRLPLGDCNAANIPAKSDRSEDPGRRTGLPKPCSEEAPKAMDKETVNPSPGSKYVGLPFYTKSKLQPHLKSKSSKGDDILSEWVIVSCEVLPSATESCPCGYKGIRNKYHIKNGKTGKTTFVGSRCILIFNFDNNNIKLHEILGKVENTGIAGSLLQIKSQNETNGTTSDREECHEQIHLDVTATFQINSSYSIVKEVGLFGNGSTPIVLPPKVERPTLTATIKHSLISTMELNKKYKIFVKFTTCSTDWTAEIVNAQPIPPKNKQTNQQQEQE